MVTKKPASPRLEQTSVRQKGVFTSPITTPRPLSNKTIVIAGVSLAAITVALFVAGFARRPITRAYHRVVARAEKIEVPMLFPVTLAETGRQIFAVMRARRSASESESDIAPERHQKPGALLQP